MLMVLRPLDERGVGDVREHVRFPREKGSVGSVLLAGLRWIASSRFAGQFQLGWVHVGNSKPVQGTLGLDNIDRAPVGKGRHRQARDLLQSTLIIDQHSEAGTGIRQETGHLLGSLPVADIRKQIESSLESSGYIVYRARRHAGPHFV